MKKYSLVILVFNLTILGYMQTEIPKDPDTKKFSYSEVITLDSNSQKVLFTRAVGWFESKYKTQNLELKNEAEGRVSHKGSFPITYKVMGFVMEMSLLYNVTISVKEEKYRYEFTDFIFSESQQGTTSTHSLEVYDEQKNKYKKEIYGQVDVGVKKMIEEIKPIMAGLKSSNDW